MLRGHALRGATALVNAQTWRGGRRLLQKRRTRFFRVGLLLAWAIFCDHDLKSQLQRLLVETALLAGTATGQPNHLSWIKFIGKCFASLWWASVSAPNLCGWACKTCSQKIGAENNACCTLLWGIGQIPIQWWHGIHNKIDSNFLAPIFFVDWCTKISTTDCTM